MKRKTEFYKFISTILHPVVVPTIGLILYFALINLRVTLRQQMIILAIIFVATYIIPIILLIVLKSIGYVKSYKAKTISERKIPVLFMISLFFFLGNNLTDSYITRDISYLFYGSSLSLVIVYLLFFLKLKTSLHMLSMGNALGFFLLIQQIHTLNVLPVIILFIFLAGLLGNSRLHLKAHTSREVYSGFIIGVLSLFVVYYSYSI